MNQNRLIHCVSRAAIVVLLCAAACGDDDTSKADSGPASAGKSGGGGKGGAGGRAGSGGKGGSGGGGAAGRSGTGGSSVQAGIGGGMMMMITCAEPAPTEPVQCGGETCVAPTEFAMNPCVVPCCVNQGGKERCASKSSAMGFSAECTLTAVPDPACPDADAMGMKLVGCCNAQQGKCGIISTLRPGCITQSMAVMLPDPPQSCTAAAEDAGVDEGG